MRVGWIAGARCHAARRPEAILLTTNDDDPAIRVAALVALRQITGKDLGVEAGPWKKYVMTLPQGDGPAPANDEAVARTAGTRP